MRGTWRDFVPIVLSTLTLLGALLGLWRGVETRLVEIQVKLDGLQTARIELQIQIQRATDRIGTLEREVSALQERSKWRP